MGSSMNCSVRSLSRSSRFCCSVFSARLDLRMLSMSLILARRYFCSSRSFFCESCSRSNSFCSLLPSNTMLLSPFRCSFASRWMFPASSRFSSSVMGCDSFSSRASVGFFFFFCDLGGGGSLEAVWTGLVSPEMRQQYFSNSLVILMKSSLGALKRQLLWKILTTSWWNCCGEEYRPDFSLLSMVVRSIGSLTISRYSGMLRPSTSTGSMKGSAHLCCCSNWRVLRHGFTASLMLSCFTAIVFFGTTATGWTV